MEISDKEIGCCPYSYIFLCTLFVICVYICLFAVLKNTLVLGTSLERNNPNPPSGICLIAEERGL